MFPHDPDSNTFPLYEYTILDEPAISINWSPSNDLCALVLQDNSLAVCRAGITPIWSTSTLNSIVTCVAWHPNGQEFVFGCQDGTVYRLNTTQLTPEPVSCWPPSDFDSDAHGLYGVSSLLWIDYSSTGPIPNVPGFDPNAFDMEEAFPGLSMVPPEEPMPLLPFQRPKKKPLPQRSTRINKTQSLLLVGDQNGALHLSLNGRSHIGTIQCVSSSLMGSIVNIDISQDLDRTQVLAQGNGYNLISLDTQALQRMKLALCNVASVEHEIDYLLRYIQHCTKIMESHHAAYTKLAAQNADKISRNLNDVNDDAIPLPQVELLGLLATGNLNPPVHEYLSNGELDQQKAKQWETKSMHSYTNVQRIIIEYLQPACERLLLQLSKLRGYGLWTERYGELISNDSVTIAIELAQQFMYTSQQLLKSVNQVSRRFQEFITWIYRVVQRIADQAQPDYQGTSLGPLYQSPNLIMEYLMEDFVTDSLATFFKDIPTKSSLSNGDMERNESISVAPLPSTLSKLVKQCKVISERPANVMPYLVKNLDNIQLNLTESTGKSHLSSESHGRQAAFHIKEDEDMVHQYYAFIEHNSKNMEQMYVVHLFWNKVTHPESGFLLSSQPSPTSTTPIGKEYSLIGLGSNWFVTDMEFLDNKELTLLLQRDGQSDGDVNGNQDMQANTFLAVIEYGDLPFHSLQGTDLISSATLTPLKLADIVTRYMELPNMHQPTMGVNGREKRRIMAVAASNGLFQVLELDKNDDDDDDDIDGSP